MSKVLTATSVWAYVDVKPSLSKPQYELFGLARAVDVDALEVFRNPAAARFPKTLELDPVFLGFMSNGNLSLEEWASIAKLFDALRPERRPCLVELRERGTPERRIREADLMSITFSRNWFTCVAEFQLRPGVTEL